MDRRSHDPYAPVAVLDHDEPDEAPVEEPTVPESTPTPDELTGDELPPDGSEVTIHDHAVPDDDSPGASEGYPADGSVDDVIAWAGEDTERRAYALAVEQEASRPRKTLLRALGQPVDDE
jgi:hypothetical protein